jgi:branched-chain amino acid transport system ATP-binding protein
MTLAIRGISAGYAGANVIHDIDISLERGERLAVLGANGAGKSTLIAVLAGFLPAHSGEMHLDGINLRSLHPHRFARAGIRWVGDPRPIYSEMSVNDNLVVGGFTARRDLRQRIDEVYDRFPELAGRRAEKAGSLSGGQSQMLALAQALVSRPRVLLLDEPSIGLSISILARLGGIVQSLAEENVAVLWSEQFPDVVLRYCESAIVMAGGYCQDKVATAEVDMKAIDAAYFGGTPLPTNTQAIPASSEQPRGSKRAARERQRPTPRVAGTNKQT